KKNHKQKIKKGVSEKHAHILLAAFTFVHSLKEKTKPSFREFLDWLYLHVSVVLTSCLDKPSQLAVRRLTGGQGKP
ncbi:hypothetical protein P7D68_21700, partial [Enterococcus avium]|uniref:hypothetical protein n=1 Tax=Enterococcus avium TaxID=33945 RepID=UPI0028911901